MTAPERPIPVGAAAPVYVELAPVVLDDTPLLVADGGGGGGTLLEAEITGTGIDAGGGGGGRGRPVLAEIGLLLLRTLAVYDRSDGR